MPMEFLREVAASSLPLSVTTESDIDKLRVLAAAGMVTAEIPEPGAIGTAKVLSVTGLGRATLKIRGRDTPDNS